MSQNRVDVKIRMRMNPQASQQVREAVFEETQQTFELDIKPAAVETSPVKTGTNRRSVDTEVRQTERGVEASLFTQSGYGGYLEVGTRHMAARPYLFPAWQQFAPKLIERIGLRLGEIRTKLLGGAK